MEEPLKFTYGELVKLLAIEFVKLGGNEKLVVKKASGDMRIQCVRCGLFGHKAGDRNADGTAVCTARCKECGSRV